MKRIQFYSIQALLFAIASLGLTAFSCLAQTNATPHPEKSSDPDIHWQFDTHG